MKRVKIRRFVLAICLVAVSAFASPCSVGWAYRPFVSTDAAVADPKEIEIEFGYFTWQKAGPENTFRVPSVVRNYGLSSDVEVVGEFRVERSPAAHWNIVDPGLYGSQRPPIIFSMLECEGELAARLLTGCLPPV